MKKEVIDAHVQEERKENHTPQDVQHQGIRRNVDRIWSVQDSCRARTVTVAILAQRFHVVSMPPAYRKIMQPGADVKVDLRKMRKENVHLNVLALAADKMLNASSPLKDRFVSVWKV